MHLRKLTLRNFRCFEEFELDLHPRLTVLVAENGGGKSAILDAIAIGLARVLEGFSTANQRLSGPGIKDTDFRLTSWAGPYGEETAGASNFAQVVLETTDGLVWDSWRQSTKGTQPESRYSRRDLSAYANDVLTSLQTQMPGLLPVFAYYGAQRSSLDIPERLRDSKVNYAYPTAALVDSLKSATDFRELLKWFDNQEAAELREMRSRQVTLFETDIRYREERAEGGRVARIYPALDGVRTAVSNILGRDYYNPHFTAKHKFVIQSAHGPEVLQVAQLSQGYQSMLALGMDFARRLAIANGHLSEPDTPFNWRPAEEYVARHHPDGLEDAPPHGPAWAPAIMLVDEVDLHLHPSWQQRVLADLMRAFPYTQFIVSTHSPQVISTVQMESIRIIKQGYVYAAPPGTDGAESQRILEDVFQVAARPNTATALALDEYLRLVDKRQWDSKRALELRAMLDAWSQGQEPRLLEADLQIDNMKWEEGR